MSRTTLTISSKNYSSWSLRGWLLAKLAGIDFDEVDRRPGRRRRAGGDPAPVAVDPGSLPQLQGHAGLGHAGDRRIPERDRPEGGPVAQRSGNARPLPLHLRRDALGLRLAEAGAADEHQGRASTTSRSGRRPRATSSGSRRSGASASRPTAVRTCSARSAWRTRCTPRSSAASAPTASSSTASSRPTPTGSGNWPAMQEWREGALAEKEEIEELEVEF